MGKDAKLEDCTKPRLKELIMQAKNPEYRLKSWNCFFNYCEAEELVHINPLRKVKHIVPHRDKPKVEFLSVENVITLLKSLPKEVCPTFALMLFCGIRPLEIIPSEGKECLKWEDINFKTKSIYISTKVAKTRRERNIVAAPENIWEWLELYPSEKRTGNVFPYSYMTYRRIRDSIPVKMTKDVCRHTFGTFGFYFLSLQTTLEILGHIGRYKTYDDHYKGQGSKEDAKWFFSLTPNNLNDENKSKTTPSASALFKDNNIVNFDDIIKFAQ